MFRHSVFIFRTSGIFIMIKVIVRLRSVNSSPDIEFRTLARDGIMGTWTSIFPEDKECVVADEISNQLFDGVMEIYL